MAGLHDTPELLGGDVQAFAGRFPFVANGRRNQAERLQAGPKRASRRQTTDHGRAARHDGGGASHGHALMRRCVQIRARLMGGLRSRKPRTPFALKRLSYLRAVRGLIPVTSAAGIGLSVAMRSRVLCDLPTSAGIFVAVHPMRFLCDPEAW